MEGSEPDGAEREPGADAPEGGEDPNQPPAPPAESDPRRDDEAESGGTPATGDQEGEATPDNPMEPGDEAPSG